MKNENKNSYTDTLYLALSEAVISILVILIYIGIGKYDWTVLTGVTLGSVTTILNFFSLSYSVNRTLNKYIELRGDKEMTDEEAAQFAKANSLKMQNDMTKSYIFRTTFMMGALVIALITKLFNPLATVIPLIMYKPLLYAIEFIKKKRGE